MSPRCCIPMVPCLCLLLLTAPRMAWAAPPETAGALPGVHKTPAQVALAWAVQRGTALLTTSTSRGHLQENFDISTLPDDAMQQIRDSVTDRVRFNTVVSTGVPGFIPRTNQAG